MKTLEQIKQDIAYKSGYSYNEFDRLLTQIKGDNEVLNHYIDAIAISYAEQALDECIANPSDMFLVSYDTINEIKNQLK